MEKLQSKINDNGTVTYWSVYNQTWMEDETYVPDCELAAMSENERELVIEHLECAKH